MKITSVDVIQLPRQDNAVQTPVLCRINTDEGIYGYGEAGVSIWDYTLGSKALLRIMAKSILGSDPLAIDVIYQKLVNGFWAQGNGGVIMAAISAIDMALWDIKGKYFNVPVYQLLGGKHRDKLWAYASQLQFGWKFHNSRIAPGDLGFVREACEAAKADGFNAVKMNVITKRLDGKRTSPDILRNHLPKDLLLEVEKKLDILRDVMGPEGEILVENHNATTAHTALQVAEVAEPFKVMLMEEPASPLNPDEYKKIAAHTRIPLATGERTYTRAGFKPLLDSNTLAVIQPDLGNCGGITEGRKICDMAQTYGVTVQTHTCNTPISTAASLQFEAAIPNFIIHELHTNNTLPVCTELCIYDYQPVNGYYEIPDLPGIGNELSDKALASAEIETIK
ncbi:MAG: mandelate racemase/muconate lactonizing enzyme family protein [Mogibacterium sp.]|nr:mandelate racemase/muconate lactonizing enzyme family protein [Mogibacterium sp.]